MKPLLIVGTEDHAQVIIDLCRCLHLEVKGVVSLSKQESASEIAGVPVLGDDLVLKDNSSEEVDLASGIGSVKVGQKREVLFNRYKKEGYEFRTLVHPMASVAQTAVIGEGAVVMAGSVVQAGATVGNNVILNTSSSVDHHCRIGDHVHIAPGSVISGRVQIGAGTFIGAGACVIQGVEIGRGCQVAAGAVVVAPVFDGSRVLGVPAGEH
ncbi:MAG: acetyltransferase [Verrucomicrobiota bacterium]